MLRNLPWWVRLAVQLAILLELAGLIVTRSSLWLGIAIILIGLVVPLAALLLSRKAAPPIQKLKESKVRTERAPAASHEPIRHQVDRQKLGLLRYTLHQANLDSNATVFETDDHKIVTVRDILVEMIDIAETYDRSVDELAKDIVAMYPKIFDNAPLALRQYPDEELAKTYIARKVMTDAHWKLGKS